MDPDVVSQFEGRLIGHGPLRKSLWLAFLSVSQALRPLKVPGQSFVDLWVLINIALQFGVSYCLWLYVGWSGLMYLLLSTFFALGLHPSGGRWNGPPLYDRYWYPIYEKMVEYDIPAMIHVSTSCNACFHTTGAHYLNADTTAFMQCLTSDLFKDFPTLRFVIPHGGGAVPYHWGRFRGLAQELKKPLLKDHLLHNIFFDTCVYHQPGIDLLTRVIPVDNILFASEMIGAVRGIDPETGHYYDDTKRYIQSAALSDADRHKIYEGNARRVFPRLDRALAARGR